MKTRYTCEDCGKTAVVNHHKRADVWSVINFIEDNHKLISPDCEFDVLRIRIRVEEKPVE